MEQTKKVFIDTLIMEINNKYQLSEKKYKELHDTLHETLNPNECRIKLMEWKSENIPYLMLRPKALPIAPSFG